MPYIRVYHHQPACGLVRDNNILSSSILKSEIDVFLGGNITYSYMKL